ncbi:MAG: hypothetical protein ACK5LP_09025 [Campylobacteraceae bacterium]
MRDIIIEVFSDHSRIIIFLHITSAVLLIGSMFCVRFFLCPMLDKIQNEEIRYNSYLLLIRNYFYFIAVLMLVLITVSVFMNIGLGFKYGNPTTYIIIHAKELCWTIMAFNFLFMYAKYRSAKKAILKEEYVEVHENIVLITKYIIPINLLIGVISIYFGLLIRGW